VKTPSGSYLGSDLFEIDDDDDDDKHMLIFVVKHWYIVVRISASLSEFNTLLKHNQFDDCTIQNPRKRFYC
jgi:hypothetical protein